jgi:hypothetical protein
LFEGEKSQNISREYTFIDTESLNKLGAKIDSLISNVRTLVEKIEASNKNQEKLLGEIVISNKNQIKLINLLVEKFLPEEV